MRSQVMQVSSKLDQVQQKVEVLASRDTPFGTGNSQVSMEAAVLMQNIHRVVQVSCILESIARAGLQGFGLINSEPELVPKKLGRFFR